MSRIRSMFAAIALALTCSSNALAESGRLTTQVFLNTASANDFNYMENVALNAAVGDRTLTLDLKRRWAKLIVIVDLTRNASTDMSLTFTGSFDGSLYGDLQSRKVDAGASTLSTLVDTSTSSVSRTLIVEYDVRGYKGIKILFGGTAADGGDLIDVQVTAVVGG